MFSGLRLDFHTYFAARTRERVNGADKVYTVRAKADWSFKAYGAVNAQGVWQRDANLSGNSGDAKFTDVPGDVQAVTEGKIMNLRKFTFEYVDLP